MIFTVGLVTDTVKKGGSAPLVQCGSNVASTMQMPRTHFHSWETETLLSFWG